MTETFEGLYVKFGANTVEFDRSVKGINNALSSLKKDFNNINRQLKMDPDNVDLLNRKLLNLQEQARVGAMKIAELKKQQKELGESEVGSAQWNKLQLEISKVESQMKVVDQTMNSTKKHIEDVGNPKSILNLNKEINNVAKELDIVNQKLELDPKNVELSEEKMKLLGKQSSLAKDKVQELKRKQEELGKEKIGTEEWRQLQNEIGQAEVEVLKIDKAMGNLGDSSRSATGNIKEATGYLKADVMMNIAEKAGQLGQKMVDAGKKTVDAWSEIDEAMDTVTTKTGLTGEALLGLQEIAKGIATSLPSATFQESADAVGELNTQFGLTGDTLQSAAEYLLKYSKITGEDISNSAINAKKAIDGAPQIKMLGLSFKEGATLIGRFEKSGIDSSAALASLSKATVNYAKDGKTLTEGLNETVNAIQNATSKTEAIRIASEVFGNRAAPKMVDAIQRGAFSFNDLAEAAQNSSGTVATTFAETKDPFDDLTTYSNKAKEGLAEIGGTLLETVIPALEPLMGMLESAVNWFTSLNETDQQTIVILGLVTTAVMLLLGAIAPLVIAIGAIGAPVGIVVAAIVAAIAAITLIIQAIMNWGTISEWLQSTWDACAAWLSELWTNIVTTATTAWSSFTAWLSEIWSSVVSTGQSLWSSFTSTLSNIFSSLISGAQSLWSSFTSTLSNLWSGLVSTGSNLFNNLSSTISGIFNGILSTASNIWNSIKSTISNAIDGAKNAVSNAIQAIKNLFNFNISWPHIPLPHFYVSGSANPLDWLSQGVPSIGIEWYAKGGIMTKPTLFGMNGNRAMVGGEAGAEAILPLNKSTLGAIGQSIANTMNTSNSINVNFSGVTIREEADLNRLADVVGTRIAEELQRKTNLRGGFA
ncbi:TPA: phage tail tape measure protein [Streptococcus pneumoniae]|uniref:phage tail tape measure protein n=1 Tax=Streptococcus pneumoniae TaxID=1313 RepID=UPI000B593F80|nr:phage tail tape measure protein [Streptococcus pneumoniae]SNJ01799.1 phage-related minor tail protein [Streptococcus pneumoniae]HET1189081.1 phage tail tape measure protein [Streptococcus pneumoniae]HEW0072739.1 phage tail tape measure protein [Streptococcus pneumoniae]HEW2683061.1 phage tail tape measure protein [Streptococcus pneumoniae]